VKFLFDENLSPRLVGEVATHWPDSTHVEAVGLRGAGDEIIWRYAHTHGFTIVSKDDDFRSLALVRGAPPKIVWLQIGNSTTSQVAQLLRAFTLELQAFSLDPAESLLSLKGPQ